MQTENIQVMTPNRDEPTRFPFVTTNPAQWFTPSSHSPPSEMTTIAMHNAVANSLSPRTLVETKVQAGVEERNKEATFDKTSTTTAGLINAQQYLSHIYQLRQQAMAAKQEMDAQVDEKANHPPVNHSNSESEKLKSILQTFVTSAGTNNLLFPYGCQLPWPATSFAAIAANQQKVVTSHIQASDVQQHKKFSNAIDPGLGDLLPPPPSLPISVSSPNSLRSGNSVPLSSTSRSEKNNSPSSDSRSKFHASIFLPQQAKHTSSSDRNQPLDLSVARRQRLEEAASLNNQNGVIVNAAGQNLPSSTYSLIVPAANMTNNNNLPPYVSVPYKPKSGLASPSTASSAFTQKQHQISTSPLVQPNPLISIPLANSEWNGSADSFADFQRESLQKWILAAQQHQQAMAAQQSSPQQRKRPNSDECTAYVKRKRFSGDQPAKFQKSATLPLSSKDHSTSENHQNASNGKRYKRYAKPPYSYVALITLAILSSSEKKLRLSQILKRISEMFPFFKGPYQGWRDSVRHNLSQNECFVKVLKNPHRPTAKGNYWTVTTSTIPRDLMTRQNTLVSRFVQDTGYNYRKDLTEVFDSVSGTIKISVPQYLLDGSDLIDDPAAIMEALLLEAKSDDDSISRMNVDMHSSGRIFSLVDMFDQDDCADDSNRRQPYGTGASKWIDKSAKARRNSFSAKPNTASQVSSPQIYPMYNAAIPYAKTAESPNIVVKMLRNASKLMNPTFNSTQNQQQQQQQTLFTQAMTATNQTSTLPLFLNMRNNAKQFQQTALTIADSSNQPKMAASNSSDVDSISPPVVPYAESSKSPSSEETAGKWNPEKKQIIADVEHAISYNDMKGFKTNLPVLPTYKQVGVEYPAPNWEEQRREGRSTLGTDKPLVSPVQSLPGSSEQSSKGADSPILIESEEGSRDGSEKEVGLPKTCSTDLGLPTLNTSVAASPTSNEGLECSPVTPIQVFSSNFATCPATVE